MEQQNNYTAARTSVSVDCLGSQLCFSVYSTMLGFNKVYRKALKMLDLTYPQYLVLMLVRAHENMPMSEICLQLKLESSTVSPLLKRMEQQGVLRRKRYAFDERQLVISLTAAGHALAQRAQAIPGYVALVSGLSREESAALRALLAKLNSELARNVAPTGCA